MINVRAGGGIFAKNANLGLSQPTFMPFSLKLTHKLILYCIKYGFVIFKP
jgi:hypothetical protein